MVGNLVTMTADSLAVTISFLDEAIPDALHCHYQDELYAQSCHVELDLRDGELSAGYDPEIGNAVPSSVWHGTVRRWGIPCLTAEAVNTLMRDIAPLAQRVLDGATVEWDGNNNVGVLIEDAGEAEQEILNLLNDPGDLDRVHEQEASDWWAEGDLPEGLTAETTDDELTAIVEREERDVATSQSQAYTVLLNADKFLAARRQEMRDELREELEEVADQYDTLKKRRNELICKLASWNDSVRYIGELAHITHPAVLKIIKKEG